MATPTLRYGGQAELSEIGYKLKSIKNGKEKIFNLEKIQIENQKNLFDPD